MSGLPAARQTDETKHGGPIVQGSLTVLIGSQGGKACSVCPGGKTNTPDPVNAQLGAKVLLGEEDQDFALPGALPVIWQRQYSSYVNAEHGAACGLLGHGWHLLSEITLEPRPEALLLFDAAGRVITFEQALQAGGQNYSASEDLWLMRGGPDEQGQAPAWSRQPRFSHVSGELAQDPEVIIAASGSADVLWVFSPTAGPRWRLTLQADRFGRRQNYSYSSGQPEQAEGKRKPRPSQRLPEGKLIGVSDGVGRRYRLRHERIHEGQPAEGLWGADDGWRVSQVELQSDSQHALADPIVLVSYSYDSQGQLRQVSERGGQIRREFEWQQRRLIAHRHRGGPWHTYRYANTPLGCRVTEHDNEQGLSYRFDYRQEAPSETGQPRYSAQVTDSLKRKDSYLFEGEGGLARLIEHRRADGSVLRYSHDGYGRLIASIDPLGQTTHIRRDAQGNVLGIQRPDGSASSQQYDEAGQITSSRDEAGAVTSYSYDPYRRLTQIQRQDQASGERYRYPEPSQQPLNCDNPSEIEDAQGGRKRLQWNASGQLISYTDCSGKSTRWDYDRWGEVSRISDAADNTTRYERNDSGQIKAIHLPDGQTESYQYNRQGQLIRVEPPRDGNEPVSAIEMAYDLWGRLIKRVHGGLSVQLQYDVAGRLHTLTNENAAQSKFSWDAMDRLVREEGFDGRQQRYQWDAGGRLIKVEDGQQQHWRHSHYSWDAIGRLTERRLPATAASAGQSQRYEWDAGGRLKAVNVYLQAANPMPQQPEQEQLQSRIEFERDKAGRLSGEIQRLYKPEPTDTPEIEFEHHIVHQLDQLGNRKASQLQEAGNIDWLLYGSGHVHGLAHDKQSLIDFERDNLHRETKRHWHTSQQAQEQPISQSRWRDQLGRLIGLELKGLPTQTPAVPQILVGQISGKRYHYDALGQVIAVETPAEAHRYGYDAAGRLRARSNSQNDQIERWRVDAAGNRLPARAINGQQQQKWAELARQHWQEPQFNLLGQGARPGNETGQIERWADNRIGYHDAGGNSSVMRYDAHGNRVEQYTQLQGGRYQKQSLGYDGAHQLSSMEVEGADEQGNTTRVSESRFTYDALGRRLKKTVKGTDGKEQVSYYGWDGDRLVHTERVQKTEDGQTTRRIEHTVYEPNSFTPLVRLSTTAKGDRQEKAHLMVQALKTAAPERAGEPALELMQGMLGTLPGHEQKMLEQSLRQAMSQGLPQQTQNLLGQQMAQSTSQLLRSMQEGMQEQQRQQRQENPITIHYYHCDHLGTPLALTDQKGNIVWAAKYDPWGNIEEEFNPHGIEQNIRLPGQHHDRETGLYYNRHRYYDPKLGSYINQDPIGLVGGINSYGYPKNPLNQTDSLGLVGAAAALPSVLGSGAAAGEGAAATAGLGWLGVLAFPLTLLSGDTPQQTTVAVSTAAVDPWGVPIDPAANVLSAAHEAAGGDRSKPGYGGRCTPDEFDQLEGKKEKLCDDASSLGRCSKGGGSPDASKQAAWGKCAKAREDVMNKCFAGGDNSHRIAAGEAWNAANNCGRIIK